MKNKKLKYHYICKDKNGGFFMTTEKCEGVEEAQMYIGDNEVLYPFFDELYEKNIIEANVRKANAFNTPIATYSLNDTIKAIEDS